MPATALPTPSVFGSYGHAWRQLWPNFGRLLLIGVVAFVISLPGPVVQGIFQVGGALAEEEGLATLGQLIGWIYSIFVGIPLFYGVLYALLRTARGETPVVEDLFAAFRGSYWASILSNLLETVFIAIGLVLLIVPGVYIAVKLAFVGQLVVDERLGAWQAIQTSWRRTSGHWWRIFGLWLMAIPIAIAGVLVLIVGIIPAAMWVWLALSTLYIAVTEMVRRDTTQALAGRFADITKAG